MPVTYRFDLLCSNANGISPAHLSAPLPGHPHPPPAPVTRAKTVVGAALPRPSSERPILLSSIPPDIPVCISHHLSLLSLASILIWASIFWGGLCADYLHSGGASQLPCDLRAA
jgi:hypothetical protein